MNYKLLLLVGFVVIIAIGFGAAYIMLKSSTQQSTTGTGTFTGISTQTTTTSVPSTAKYNLLVFTQKGMVMVVNPFAASNNFLGFQRIVNISTTVPTQVYWWLEFNNYNNIVTRDIKLFVPINNGTVYVVDTQTMKIIKTFVIGNKTGYIGAEYSPDMKYVVLVNGPSGVVEVVDANSLQVIWQKVFISNGKTLYPCDARWSPDGKYIIIPMRYNDSITVLDSNNGNVIKVLPTSKGSQPYMLNINSEGNLLAVEYVGNKSIGFYSFPDLSFKGVVTNAFGHRGVFTPDSKYYLEASADKNQVAVISTSNFSVVKIISLPSTSVQGLTSIFLAPGGQYAITAIHGDPSSGGIIVLISLSDFSIAYQIPLTNAPAILLPIDTSTTNYLLNNNVLNPPTTGLHC